MFTGRIKKEENFLLVLNKKKNDFNFFLNFFFFLTGLAPFVLRGSCPQCSPQEMKQIQKTLAHVQRSYPAQWNKLIQQYVG